MRNRRFPTDAVGGGGGGSEDGSTVNERERAGVLRDMQTTKLTGLGGQQTHTYILLNVSAQECNHASLGCCGFRACGTGSVIVRSF